MPHHIHVFRMFIVICTLSTSLITICQVHVQVRYMYMKMYLYMQVKTNTFFIYVTIHYNKFFPLYFNVPFFSILKSESDSPLLDPPFSYTWVWIWFATVRSTLLLSPSLNLIRHLLVNTWVRIWFATVRSTTVMLIVVFLIWTFRRFFFLFMFRGWWLRWW